MLYKNVVQTFRKKWLQLLAVGIIVFFSSFIYSSMFYAISGLEDPTLNYLDEYVQEDFSIEMISVLSADEIAGLRQNYDMPADLYTLADLSDYQPRLLDTVLKNRLNILTDLFSGISLEVRQFKDFYFSFQGEEHRGLIIRNNQIINRSYIEAGHHPQNNQEIALTRVYAEKNELVIGDRISLQEKDYLISGFVLFPDYTYAAFDQSFIVDNAKLTLFLAVDTVFEQLSGQRGFRFAGIFDDQEGRSDYEKMIMDIPADSPAAEFVLGATLTENQFRSGAIFTELMSAKIFGLGFGLIIAVIAVFIVALILSRILDGQQRQIGVLKALGYPSRKIAWPYLGLITFLALPMLILGYLAGFWAGDPLMQLMLDFYLIPSIGVKHNLNAFITATLLPLIFFTTFSGLILFRMLAKGPLELLHKHQKDKVNRLTRLASKFLHKRPGRTKFKYLYMLQNTGKFLVFFFGIILAAVLILIGLMMNGMVERMTIAAYERVDYQYEAYLDLSRNGANIEDGQEKFLVYPDAFYNNKSLTVVGLEWDNQLYRLYDTSGDDITAKIQHDAVISRTLSMKEGLGSGDSINLVIGNRQYPVKIDGITEDYSEDKIFISIERLSLMISDGSSTELFSGIYSLHKPDADQFSTILAKQSIIDQARILQDFFQYVVYIMIISAVLIAVLILFLLASLTIEDNYYNISLLQIMGYRKKEVNAMVLDSYLVYSLLAYLVSLPIALVLLSGLVNFFAVSYNIYFALEFHFLHAPTSLAVLLAIYLAGTWQGRRKIARIPLQEIIKVYDE